ncbi:uncharacterized protein LOC117118968 [Anneissia japonica]|uniref:uncharacterized protein LOC117118968 n=1 Tax=Anneissia japonica TaxID=1529436 RepID=UPI00142565BC|nr:uncharacterized protein LOC117118968 [Anneissia japonica]
MFFVSCRLFHDKPIVRAPAPLDFEVEPNLIGKPQKFHKPAVNISDRLPAVEERRVEDYPEEVDREELEELARIFRWTSTTRAATEEACLPVIEKPLLRQTLEVNADLAMNKPKRYESTPRLWQRVAPRWEQTQERSEVPCISTRKMWTTSTDSNPENTPKKYSSKVTISEETYRLAKENKLTSTFVRQAPGYAGFVPRTPLEIPMARAKTPAYKPCSTMRNSFRPFPAETLCRLLYYRRGPLSKTVTLTYPFNPFSKVEQRAFLRNHVGLERTW